MTKSNTANLWHFFLMEGDIQLGTVLYIHPIDGGMAAIDKPSPSPRKGDPPDIGRVTRDSYADRTEHPYTRSFGRYIDNCCIPLTTSRGGCTSYCLPDTAVFRGILICTVEWERVNKGFANKAQQSNSTRLIP